jgi:hypothetical protein
LLSFGEENLVFQLAIKKLNFNIYRTKVLAVFFVWVRNLVAHIEERRLNVFENRVLRRIF